MTALQGIRTRIRHKGGDQKYYRIFITQPLETQDQTAEEHEQTNSQSMENEMSIPENMSQHFYQNETTKL